MTEDRYYLVDVLAAKGGRQASFTYKSTKPLALGSLVKVSLGRQPSVGVVKSQVSQPDFATKEIDGVFPVTPLPAAYRRLADWMAEYYAAPLARVWQTMLPQASLNVGIKPAIKDSKPIKPKALPNLTNDQRRAFQNIRSSDHSSFLLHGVTGSGKTRLYMELAKSALAQNQSVIVLVPEIALTPQIVSGFTKHFPGQVLLTHSGLTSAQRRDVWLRASTAAHIVIGPRSALFTPLPSLGFVIIDESHDSSYKQDQSPRYHAHLAAATLAKFTGAKLVLGTATPQITNMYWAQAGRLQLVKLTKPVFKADLRPPQIVDLRDKQNLSHSRLLSDQLLEVLTTTLKRKRQSLLFLNRRGSARLILCKSCGWQANCPNCHIPLTWHGDRGRMLCHWCGYSDLPPAECPQCQSLDIRYLGSGTKQLENELAQALPTARVHRLDKDNFDVKTINQLYRRLEKGSIDILLGTQMISKGLDLPGVETVGVILADNSLYVPDFSAGERTFQLLYQVSGRAGRRRGRLSNVIIQTYSPTHPAIVAAAERDYQSFYKNELAERQALNYPPFTFLLKLWLTKASQELVISHSRQLARRLTARYPKVIEVIGPAPAWQEHLGGKFTWQIIVKSPRRSTLQSIVQDLPIDWLYDLDPIDLL